jgi:hypothetical protein
MSQRTMAHEAADCRFWAQEFAGRPEQNFLLRLAIEFELLAEKAVAPINMHDHDQSYFARRASQEVTAAVKAKHPKARLAHLKMAQSYEAMTSIMR